MHSLKLGLALLVSFTISAAAFSQEVHCVVPKTVTSLSGQSLESVLVQPVVQDDVESQVIRINRERSEKLGARRALRKLERKLRREGKRKDAANVRKILNDSELFDAFYHGHVAPAMFRAFGDQSETPIIDFWRDLLQYVIEHQDEIIDFIKKIIDLFAVNLRPQSLGIGNQYEVHASLNRQNWLRFGQVQLAA